MAELLTREEYDARYGYTNEYSTEDSRKEAYEYYLANAGSLEQPKEKDEEEEKFDIMTFKQFAVANRSEYTTEEILIEAYSNYLARHNY